MKKTPEGKPDESTIKGVAQRGAITLAQNLEEALFEGDVKSSKSLSKKEGKALKKKHKKSEQAEPVAPEKISSEEAEKQIAALEEQVSSNVELLRALKDATEFATEGEKFVESILTLLGEEVRIATEQNDEPAVDLHNQRRSAVGRLIVRIGDIKQASVLEKITGEIIADLFDRAISGNLTLAQADTELSKYTSMDRVMPSRTEPVVQAEVLPTTDVSTPAERPASSPFAEQSAPTKKEGKTVPAEALPLDLSNPKNIPEFIRLLRSAKNRTIEAQFPNGRLEKVRVQDMAEVAQRHIFNLKGMAKNPQRQSKEALGILKVAPQDFGYREGLRKLFIVEKFIEDTPAPKPVTDSESDPSAKETKTQPRQRGTSAVDQDDTTLNDRKMMDPAEASATRAEKIRFVEESMARIADEQSLITAIITDPKYKPSMVKMGEVLKPLREILAKEKSLKDASLAKKVAGYPTVATELSRMRHELEELIQSAESTKGTPEASPTESTIAGVRKELEEVYQSIEKAWVDSDYGDDPKLTKKILSILPGQSMDERIAEFADKSPQEKLAGYTGLLTQYREILANLQTLLVENAHLLKKDAPKVAEKETKSTEVTAQTEPLVEVKEVDGEVRLKLGPEAKAKRDELIEKETKSKKKASNPKAETVPEIPQEALDQEQRQLQMQFAEIEAKVAVLLSLHKADAEIQSHAPKEVGADILLKLEGKSFSVRNTILQESLVTYRNALQAIEAILDQRKQARATATGGASSRSSTSTQSAATSGASIPPASTVPAPRQGWLQSRWAKAVSYAAAGAALLGIGFGVNELVKKVSEKNAKKGDRPETAERTPGTNETAVMPRSTEDTLRPTRSVERPQANQVRTPDAPRTAAAVESYPGINFNAELLKYPGAIKSGWVLELFTNADRDVQMIQTPQDFHRFFEHYFGELNLGNREFMPNRDPKVDQQQLNEFNRRFRNSTRFDVKMAYKWIGPEDVKLRLALATKLREVLIATHFRFANTAGADNFIHYPQRLNNCAVLMNTLIKGITEHLDPSFDYKTITADTAVLDRLIEAQKQRN